MQMRLAPASLPLVAAFASLALAACVTGPTNGTTVAGSVIGKQISFAGYYNVPSALVRLQVMSNPTLDPNAPASWVDFATATTGTSPTYVNSTDPLYPWSVTAAPVPNAAAAARWPQGGLVKIRATTTQGGITNTLVTFDEVTFGTCLGEHLAAGAAWNDIGIECAGTGGNHLALVSTSNPPVLPGGPGAFSFNGFLGRKGAISVTETQQYYAATNAPATLAAFKSRHGFPGNEVTATYYNNGDLGLGREMHCKNYLYNFASVGLACYVNNYSGVSDAAGRGIPAFNVSPTTVLADATARQHNFATVAMTWEGTAATNPVKFVVYDASGNLATTAQLDSTANSTAIPTNCISCHGISANYDPVSNSVSAEARFLPFDPYSFKFSTAPGFTFADQAGALRALNALVRQTAPGTRIAELIDGMYAPKAVTDPTAVSNDDFVPAGWQSTGSLDGEALYRGVVKPACRTCHISSTNATLELAEYSDFETRLASIKSAVCGSHVMPHAERVMKNFWESGARAYLITAFPATSYPDALGGCGP